MVLIAPSGEWKLFTTGASEAMLLPDASNPHAAKVIVLALYGRLKSGRDKEFNCRTSEQSHMAWARENERWFKKVAVSGVRKQLETSILTWHREGLKARLTAIVYRRGEQIDDYKNLVVGLDQGILDGMKHGGVLVDDSMNHIDHHHYAQERTDGQEFVWMRWERGGPCPEFVVKQAINRLRVGTVDPASIVSQVRQRSSRWRRYRR